MARESCSGAWLPDTLSSRSGIVSYAFQELWFFCLFTYSPGNFCRQRFPSDLVGENFPPTFSLHPDILRYRGRGRPSSLLIGLLLFLRCGCVCPPVCVFMSGVGEGRQGRGNRMRRRGTYRVFTIPIVFD